MPTSPITIIVFFSRYLTTTNLSHKKDISQQKRKKERKRGWVLKAKRAKYSITETRLRQQSFITEPVDYSWNLLTCKWANEKKIHKRIK